MPLRVHAHAAIWVENQLVVHRRRTNDRDQLTLPGGRVKERESVIDALRREILEEIGLEVEVGDLLFAGEVNATSRQNVVLMFEARLIPDAVGDGLTLVDPAAPEAKTVLPPVLERLTGTGPTWIGELYRPPHT